MGRGVPVMTLTKWGKLTMQKTCKAHRFQLVFQSYGAPSKAWIWSPTDHIVPSCSVRKDKAHVTSTGLTCHSGFRHVSQTGSWTNRFSETKMTSLINSSKKRAWLVKFTNLDCKVIALPSSYCCKTTYTFPKQPFHTSLHLNTSTSMWILIRRRSVFTGHSSCECGCYPFMLVASVEWQDELLAKKLVWFGEGGATVCP